MQIVIEIDNKYYNDIKNRSTAHPYSVLYALDSIRNGIPLPKNHGDLIDAYEIQFENVEFDTYGDYSRAFDAIDRAPTIIEAESEEEG